MNTLSFLQRTKPRWTPLRLAPLHIALSSLFLASGTALADDALPPIVVSGARPAASATSSAFSGAAVAPSDIAARRAATSDTASLLDGLPGVSLYGAGGISSLPVIHGLADDRLRILVDGVDSLSSCPNHMNPALSYIDPSNVAAIRVYAGVTPVSVGGDSIGGAIVVDSAAPRFAAPGQAPLVSGQAGVFYRSNNNAKGGNLTATYATDQINLTYSGSTSKADNYTAGRNFKTFAATGRPGETLPLDEVGSTAYKVNDHSLNLALKHENHLFEIKYSFQDAPYEGFPNQRMDLLDNTAHRLNLHYLGTFDWGSLDGRAWHETVRHAMNFGDDKQFWYGNAPGMPMETDSSNSGAALKAEISLNSTDRLRLGSEYQRYRLDDWWPPSGSGMMMAPNTFINLNDGQRDRATVYAEWEARLAPAWTTLLGARYEHVRMDADPVHGYSAMYATDANKFNASDRSQADNNWDASAIARYTPSDMQDISFGLSRKVRSPNLYERFAWSRVTMAMLMVNFAGDGNGYVGNPDLKPEKAHTVSATFDWHAADRSWEFQATPYYTYVTDYIDARRCGSGMGMMASCGGVANNTGGSKFVYLQFANQSARLYGIDLSGHAPLGGNATWGSFSLAGTIGYVNGENRDTGDDLYNIMPLNARLSLQHTLAGWNSNVELVLVKNKNNLSDVRNEIPTAGYSLVNLRTSHTWGGVRLDLGIDNLFDRFYQLPLGGAYVGQGKTMSGTGVPWGIAVPGMGRSIYTGLSYAF